MTNFEPIGYLERRDAEIERLYIECGLESREIAIKMLKEGTLKSESEDSAMRTVRGVVMRIRERINLARFGDADAKLSGNEVDALERKLGSLRALKERQQMISDGEPTEMCSRSRHPIESCPSSTCRSVGSHISFVGPAVAITVVYTPQGPISTYKALWPAGVRQKAAKDLVGITEKIEAVETRLMAMRDEHVVGDERTGGDRLHLIESDKSIEELIEENLLVGTFGTRKKTG